MVLRLFVPPGEGQHRLVPKRPDPIGANATLQYTVLSSTALAAAYTSFASRYAQNVTPTRPISRPAVFIRTSARLGVWAGVAGAALNCYYYSAFANVVVSKDVPEVKPWKLYERTKNYTVEDGALAGAALGLAVSVPTLFMRRPAIPRWTRCLGMKNIGACAGVLGAHAYFQYTGERQEAYKDFVRQVKRRSLEFWSIFWDAELMASLDPIMQQYVRHNDLWYARWLPQEVFDRAEQDVEPAIGSSELMQVPGAPVEQQPPFYITPIDYVEDLRRIDIKSTLASMEAMEADRIELLQEAEYLLYINAQQKYAYCHTQSTDQDERRNHLQQIHLVEVAYNRLRAAAHDIDVKLVHWRMSLKHKAAWEAATQTTKPDKVVDWLPEPQIITPATHQPTYSMGEIKKVQWQIAAEVKRFEEGCNDERYPGEKRERWRRDAEDGRAILRAADGVLERLERVRAVGNIEPGSGSGSGAVKATTDAVGLEVVATPVRKEIEKPRMDEDKS